MDVPVDYGEVGRYLSETRRYPTVKVHTPYHSTWLDNTKAKLLLGWQPEYDLEKIIDSAWDYERAANDTRKVWYPG
jgi:nucleoside-diphosphate-sugar epimerase